MLLILEKRNLERKQASIIKNILLKRSRINSGNKLQNTTDYALSMKNIDHLYQILKLKLIIIVI